MAMSENYVMLDGERYEIDDLYDRDTMDVIDGWGYGHMSLAVRYRVEEDDE